MEHGNEFVIVAGVGKAHGTSSVKGSGVAVFHGPRITQDPPSPPAPPRDWGATIEKWVRRALLVIDLADKFFRRRIAGPASA